MLVSHLIPPLVTFQLYISAVTLNEVDFFVWHYTNYYKYGIHSALVVQQ